MNREKTAGDLALEAAAAIRDLNHATLTPDDVRGYEWPSDVDDVVAALQLLVDRLPQAFEQAGRWLKAAVERDTVGHDADADPVQAVATALVVFGAVQQDLVRLSVDVQRLRDITSHLTGIGTGRAGG